jgi:phage anti-repressor protein
MTAAANDWKDAILHCLVMEKGAINLVMQKEVSVEQRDEPLKLVTNYFVWSKFGIKTFTEGAERMYEVRLLSQANES